MSFNSFLLSLFAKNTRLGSNVESLYKRYQILANLYINIGMICAVGGFEIIAKQFFKLSNASLMSMILLPSASFCFYLIYKEMYDHATLVTILYMHVVNYFCGHCANAPVAGLYAVSLFPFITFFLSASAKVRNLNTVLCFFQFIGHSMAINKAFEVTLEENQSLQIALSISAHFCGFVLLTVICPSQKAVEFELWKVAQFNYEKSENLIKEVLQSVQAKDAFVSALSHEIRNPLNSMGGSIEYLLGVAKEPSHLQVLKNAKMSYEILLNLLNNTLDAAKLKSDKMDLNFSETNIGNIIQKVFTINSEALKTKHIFAEAFIDKKLPDNLWLDPSRCLQIIMNLVSNALKFTPKGGKVSIIVSWCSCDTDPNKLLVPNRRIITKLAKENSTRTCSSLPGSRTQVESEINPSQRLDTLEEFSFIENEVRTKNINHIRTLQPKAFLQALEDPTKLGNKFKFWNIQRDDVLSRSPKKAGNGNASSNKMTSPEKNGYLKIEISDNGCGIAEEDIGKLFEMFVQSRSNVRPHHSGTGLGLWICKQLILKMGGDIALYSKVNYGTTFVFYIPVSNNHMQEPQSVNANPSHGKINALVVDDYAYNRNLHKLLLERQGINVTVACDGKEALEQFKAKENDYFDFIMMDVQMPVMDGLTSAKLIREYAALRKRNVDIYFVSGEYYSDDVIIEKFRTACGTSDVTGIRCLKKPVEVNTIKKIVEKYTKVVH